MEKGRLKKLILPLILEQLLAVSVGMADTFMVSTVGEAAISGVSLVDGLNLLILQVMLYILMLKICLLLIWLILCKNTKT